MTESPADVLKRAERLAKGGKGGISLGDYALQLAGSNIVLLDRQGNPVWSTVARELQEKARKKELAERCKVSLEEAEKAAAQIALAQTGEEEEEKPKVAVKVAGKAEEGCYEAIYDGDTPAFLVYSNDQFKTLSEVHEGDLTVKPPDREMCPYPPYRFHSDPVEIEALRREVYAEFKAFVDAEETYRQRWVGETFLTYQQEKLMTVLYEFLVGSEEAGKTHVANLMSLLMYRPLYGTSIPAADIYSYLATHPYGVILEDEIRGVERDVDKRKVYLAGYKQGAAIPRIFDLPDGTRIIKYFPCFGFKLAADRALVKDSAFMERFAVAYMLEGYPEKDEFTKEDVERLLTLRDKLLKWRMQNMDLALPEVDPGVSGRLKELWKPLLQIGALIGNEKELRGALAAAYKEKRRVREESLEAAILGAYMRDLSGAENEYIPSDQVWNNLTATLEGDLDQKKPQWFHSSEHGDISKALVGWRLAERLGAERKTVSQAGKKSKAWMIPHIKLLRMVKRFICYRVTDLRVKWEGDRAVWSILCPDVAETEETLKQASLMEIGEKKGDSETAWRRPLLCGNETVAPLHICKIGNSVTGPLEPAVDPEEVSRLVKLDPPETGECACCGNRLLLEVRAEGEKGVWGKVCLDCADWIKRENPEVEWFE